MSAWSVDSNFEQNVEVKKRPYDGKFNLWIKELFVDVIAPEETYWAWSIVNVLDTYEEANKEREKLRAVMKRR